MVGLYPCAHVQEQKPKWQGEKKTQHRRRVDERTIHRMVVDRGIVNLVEHSHVGPKQANLASLCLELPPSLRAPRVSDDSDPKSRLVQGWWREKQTSPRPGAGTMKQLEYLMYILCMSVSTTIPPNLKGHFHL